MSQRIEDNFLIETSYYMIFEYRDGSSSYWFDCDADGKLLHDEAKENYQKCIDGTFDVVTDGIEKHEQLIALCRCGSKQPRYPVHDARGIFVAYCCERCEDSKLSVYRPEIFHDSNYHADECIEPDY